MQVQAKVMPSGDLIRGSFHVGEDEVCIGTRGAVSRLDEAAIILASGGKVCCEEDLARSGDVLVRDDKGKFLAWTH